MRPSPASSRGIASAWWPTTTPCASSRRARSRPPAAKRSAVARLRELGPGGSTNLSGGWFTGCEQVANFLETEAVNRTLLLTDGLANVGLIDRDALAGHAAELRSRGVSTTTFGVGNDFDEALLQAMSDAGGGHFYYIANPAQIRDHIASEVGETLEVVARDVELDLVAGDGIQVEAISPHGVTSRGSRSIVTIGDLVADQAVEVVLRVTFPYGERGRETGLIVGDGRGGDVRLTWTYADDRTNDDQPRDAEVDRAVGRQFAARARQEAVQLNRDGRFDDARRRLAGTARRIATYADGDAELQRLVRELQAEGVTFAAPMPAALLKEAHFVSANVARSRDALGRSVRRST